MLQPSPTKSTVKAVVKSPTKRVEFKKTKRDIEIEKTNKGNASGVRAKSGTTMKKAKSGFAALAPPYDKATFADKIAGAKKNAGKAKSGAKMAKQAAVAIAMKKAGKTPKKAMNGYGGAAASMVPMKSGGKMKKCKYGCK